MKRLLLTLAVAGTASLAAAQVSADGFYRIQNKTSNRYVTIVNDRAHKSGDEIKADITAKTAVEVYALATRQEVVSDPGSILYLEKNTGGKYDYNIKGQGMYTYTLTGGRVLNVYHNQRSGNDYYQLYASESSVTFFLKDNDNARGGNGYCSIATNSGTGNAQWNVIPVSQSEYLGITPEVSVGGKHYATLYTSFAYQLSAGMKAYYVSQQSSKAAELTEIAGNIVPEATPVIIECSSTKPADNKVTPLTTAVTAINGNRLTGVYFSYVLLNALQTAEATDSPIYPKLKNATTANASTMRVLGVAADGQLALVKPTTSYLYLGKYLPANKAYITVSASAAADLPLLNAADYAAAGISSVTADEQTGDVYDLSGHKVAGKAESLDALRKGIYIRNGKKIVRR